MENNKKKEGDSKFREGEDYYFNEEGLMVLTAKYLLQRGFCCQNGCKHCPYGFKKDKKVDS